MATIRKRGAKWQVQVRRVGHHPVSQSFHILKDAEAWARHVEVQADRGELPRDPKVLRAITLGEIVERYRDTVSIKKRGYDVERIVLTAFLRHPICRKRLSQIRADDFAAYRDERLERIKATTLKRELSPLHNLFEVARDEWRVFPITANAFRLAWERVRRRAGLDDLHFRLLSWILSSIALAPIALVLRNFAEGLPSILGLVAVGIGAAIAARAFF